MAVALESTDESPVSWPEMTKKAVAAFFEVSPRWIGKLEEDRFVERLPSGLYDVGAVCRGYARWLQSDERRPAKTAEGRRFEAEKVRKIRIEIDRLLDRLIHIDTVDKAFRDVYDMLHEEMTRVPPECPAPLQAECNRLIEDGFARCRRRWKRARQGLVGERPILEAIDE